MSLSTSATSTDRIVNAVYIYGGLFIAITGSIGHSFNLCVFLSLRTFRELSCSLYLILMSIANVGEILLIVLPRVAVSLIGTDGTDLSIIWCKSRAFLSHYSQILAMTSFCLVTIDQYCATSHYQILQKFCKIRIAQSLIIFFALIWFIHGFPYAIYFIHTINTTNGKITCMVTDPIYLQYRMYAILIILVGYAPLIITTIFGFMAFYNVQKSSSYAVPLVRRELDKQLTQMILVQALIDILILLPNTIINLFVLNINWFSSSYIQAQIRLTNNITYAMYYIHACVSCFLLNFDISFFNIIMIIFYIEFILYLFLCFGTIPSTSFLCFE